MSPSYLKKLKIVETALHWLMYSGVSPRLIIKLIFELLFLFTK